MTRPALIALLGLLLALGSGTGVYLGRVASYRALCADAGMELAWIKMEFGLNAAEFQRVRKLHEAYKPVCEQMCQRIDEKNRQLAGLLATSTNVTPEIEAVLGEAAQLRQQCQTEMLKHFFAVSHAMPPEQGRRYLAWMQEQTLNPTHQSMVPRVGPQPSPHDDRD